jgi:Calcium-dependent channel, 7TM region, putative phosphate
MRRIPTNLTASAVTLVVSLTQVESLKGTLSFLARWVERWPWIEQLLALIAPLVLILLNTAILPLLLKGICRFEHPVSESTLEASSFVKMTSFVVRLMRSSMIVLRLIHQRSPLLDNRLFKPFLCLLYLVLLRLNSRISLRTPSWVWIFSQLRCQVCSPFILN